MRDPEVVAYSPNYNTQMLYFTCSSLIEDDSYLFEISDRGGHPNVWVRNLSSSTVCQLSDNRASYQKSYVYFDGEPSKGLAKASVALDSAHGIVYYIQDNDVYQANRNGIRKNLSKIENGEMTAFCHVNSDGLRICVPTVEGRALDFDPQTEGTGLDKRPAYNIDERIQKEHLCSYLNVFSTETGVLLFRQRVPNAWITHVQFCPNNNNLIMFNNEWPYRDCCIRRIWLSDGERFWQVRKEGAEAGKTGYAMKCGPAMEVPSSTMAPIRMGLLLLIGFGFPMVFAKRILCRMSTTRMVISTSPRGKLSYVTGISRCQMTRKPFERILRTVVLTLTRRLQNIFVRFRQIKGKHFPGFRFASTKQTGLGRIVTLILFSIMRADIFIFPLVERKQSVFIGF